MLRHEAGLAILVDDEAPLDATKDRTLSIEDLEDLDRLAAVLAASIPFWGEGAPWGTRMYHAVWGGWLMGEIVRRVDPQHRTLGEFFRQEVARPLGVDFIIGVQPEEEASHRFIALQSPGLPYLLTKLVPHFVCCIPMTTTLGPISGLRTQSQPWTPS